MKKLELTGPIVWLMNFIFFSQAHVTLISKWTLPPLLWYLSITVTILTIHHLTMGQKTEAVTLWGAGVGRKDEAVVTAIATSDVNGTLASEDGVKIKYEK